MLEQQLFTLGFTGNEVKVYLELAELGKATAHALAKRTTVPRTTVYSVLGTLIEKGLVSLDPQEDSTYYLANNPSSLLRLIEKRKTDLAAQEAVCREAIELISPLFRQTNYSVPRLQFFEGAKNLENMLYDCVPLWHDSMRIDDNTWWGYQDPTVLEEYTEWLYFHWETRDPGLRIKLFSHPAAIERQLKNAPEGREIRVVPQGYNFNSTIWVCGEYIIMIMTRQRPHYAFQLKDAVFASNLKLIFALLWESKLPEHAYQKVRKKKR